MRCEDRKQALSLFVDGALAAGGSSGLFVHLEGCAGCRAFLESLLAMRRDLAADRDRALLEGDELLPARLPAPGRATARAIAPERPGRPRWAFAPAAALALAGLLLAAGIAIGTRIPGRRAVPAVSPPSTGADAPPGDGPAIVYVYSMPEFPVIATPPAGEDE